jgi:hypothetical protein
MLLAVPGTQRITESCRIDRAGHTGRPKRAPMLYNENQTVAFCSDIVACAYIVMWPLLSSLLLLTVIGCTTTLPALPEPSELSSSVPTDASLVVGHVLTVLMGPTTRAYVPELRFFELINTATRDRVRVEVESDDRWFILPLPPGNYELSRLQVSEGGFLATATLNPGFKIFEGQVTYVGTWRLGIESPQYDRSVLLSAVAESEDTVREALAPYRSLQDRTLLTYLLSPAAVETRLYEVPPYPRYWWFRRHHTS